MKIYTFDTTLRDGTQGEYVSFSVDGKLMIAQKLDDLGIDYIEGGWPGSNPRDREFFEQACCLKLRHAKLTAFGSTRFARNPVEQDRNVRALVEAGTPVVSVFGKSWDLHVRRALGITEEENLELIADTVRYLKAHGKEVVYDAEHFFDGYRAKPAYALKTLETAKNAGADVLCLCDTNGGTLSGPLAKIVAEVVDRFAGVIGIHAHNDSDVAVANTLAAVEAGATHVQGCINGYGERCGNANLCSVIANLELKLGHTTVGPQRLATLKQLSHAVAEIANLPVRSDQPYTGKSAFAHKGGVHVSAVLKDSATYEHIRPETVGAGRRVLVSDLAGRSNVRHKLKQFGFAGRLKEPALGELVEQIKQREYEGCDLETAEGTLELMVLEAICPGMQFFEVQEYIATTRRVGRSAAGTQASVTLNVHGSVHTATANGYGPIHALDRCMRQCLSTVYPGVAGVRLTDYKVRVLDSRKGTASKVRVLGEWSDDRGSWTTVGVSDNIIEASWAALQDAIRLELARLARRDGSLDWSVEDYSWAV